MPRTHHVALVLAASLFACSGCGSNAKSTQSTSATAPQTTTGEATRPSPVSTKSSGPLTRTELIIKADAICYGINAKRATIKYSTPADYIRLLMPFAEYQSAAVTRLSKLIPPPSMEHSWRKIVAGARTVADITGVAIQYVRANKLDSTHPLEVKLARARTEMTSLAKREGFKDCAQVS